MKPDIENILKQAITKSTTLIGKSAGKVDLPPRYLAQFAHLTCPATVWKYIEKAEQSNADLVMLDLEDAIPYNDEALLSKGRDLVVRAFTDLQWEGKLRYFRPRGLEADPGFSDMAYVIERVGDRIDGLTYPKVDSAEEVSLLDRTMGELEIAFDLIPGSLKLQVLIESVEAERQVYEIAEASPRLTALVFGAFDYWGSLGMRPDLYYPDHPIIRDVRCKIVKAAARVGIPAIAEMTLNYPTKNKTEEEREAALEECRQDARLAMNYGFAGKWTGIPMQTDVVREVFFLPDEVIEKAVRETKAYLEAKKQGKGAAMIDGKMADRATDRINRVILMQALQQKKLDPVLAEELRLV